MTGVGVEEAPALRLEDAVEAGDECVGWHVRMQDLVGLLQYPPRSDAISLGYGAQHALGVRHNQSRRDPLAGDIAYNQANPTILQAEEVVEVAADLSRGLVVVGYLPAFEL